jgi:hypothetical protein
VELFRVDNLRCKGAAEQLNRLSCNKNPYRLTGILTRTISLWRSVRQIFLPNFRLHAITSTSPSPQQQECHSSGAKPHADDLPRWPTCLMRHRVPHKLVFSNLESAIPNFLPLFYPRGRRVWSQQANSLERPIAFVRVVAGDALGCSTVSRVALRVRFFFKPQACGNHLSCGIITCSLLAHKLL